MAAAVGGAMTVTNDLLEQLKSAADSLFPVALLAKATCDFAETAVSLAVLRQHQIGVMDFVAAALPIPGREQRWCMVGSVDSKDQVASLTTSSSPAAADAATTAAVIVSASTIDVVDTLLNDGAALGKSGWLTSAASDKGVARCWLYAEAPAKEATAAVGGSGVLVASAMGPWKGATASDKAFTDAAANVLASQAALGWVESIIISHPHTHLSLNVPLKPDAVRKVAHKALMLPNRPVIRLENALFEANAAEASAATQPAWYPKLVDRVHEKLPQQPLAMPRSIPNATTHLVQGAFDYYHYCLDGFDDNGWGCAYRSLQTVLSWFQRNQYLAASSFVMPDLGGIQKILSVVDPEKRKQANFIGSKTWIGSVEVMLVLQHFIPALECQLQRLEAGSQLASDVSLHRRLAAHFDGGGAPVMIGGAAYAHTIIGINCNVRTGEAQYLILDPHYPSERTDLKTCQQKGWVGWKDPVKFFDQKQWYNLCLPLTNSVDWA